MSKSLVWTDDEVELLLKVTGEYKTAKQAEDTDWESVHSKYADVLERFLDQYPPPDTARAEGKDFPHKKDEITKVQFTTKLKNIRAKYRQALGSGRKNGHGRVVLLYFEQCESIWGGSRASQALWEGVETSDVLEGTMESVPSPADTRALSVPGGDTATGDVLSSETVASQHHRPLDSHRRDRLKRKLWSREDSVLREDLDVKRRLLQQLEETDDRFMQTMRQCSSMMDRLNSNIQLLMTHILGSESSDTTQPQPSAGAEFELELE